MNRVALLPLLGLLLGPAAPAAAAEGAKKPNVVFILADDLGWTDLGCQGSKYYETPNLDKLAKGGMRFTNGYTCGPNCQPTRAALMSGQYGPRTGVYTVGHTDRFDTRRRPLVPVPNVQQLPKDKVTLGDALKKAGYATGYFGKWHLGNGAEYHPSRRGFDEALVSAGQHFDFKTQPPVKVPEGTYLADYLTDRAEAFLDKNKAKPFFLYLAHFAVHSPHRAKEKYVEKFKDKPASGGHRDPTYAAMIASLDESVGRVVKKLQDLKLDKDTLILFSSDNGGVGGYVAAGVKTKEGITNNAPLRGGKGMLYEGGVRVPWIACWPGKVKAGAVCHEPILSVDLFPTLLDVAGAKPPAKHPLDGVSFLPLLAGAKAKLDRKAIYWHFPGYLGAGKAGKDGWRTTPAGSVRAGDWKLLEFFEDGRLELYNLKDDVGEKKNLAAKETAKRDELHKMLRDWRAAVKAPLPKKREKDKAP